MVTATVLDLSRCRWNLPVISRLYQSELDSFVSLAEGLSASRDSLRRALGKLTELGWVLRRDETHPRYLLSRAGQRIAPPCVDILDIAREQEVQPLALRRWTLPITSALHGWDLRFAELKALLPDVTPRALTMALKDMLKAGLVEREIIGGFPPSAIYRLTHEGKRFLPPLNRLKE